MKKINLLCFVLLFSCLVACDGEDVNPSIQLSPAGPIIPTGPDHESPLIDIISPPNDNAFLVIERVALTVSINDQGGLKEVRVLVADLESKEQVLVSFFDLFYENTNVYNGSIYLPRTNISLPAGAETIRYTAIVEAEDKSQHNARDSVSFTIHAPDLNKNEFIEVSSQVDIYQYLDWMGLVIPNEPDAALGIILFAMTDKYYDWKISNTEWTRFAQDFDLKDQVWQTWDLDGNGSLSNVEFKKGITRLNFHKDWDLNNNSRIELHELGAGFFDRWDHNKDNVLSREEYEERFYTYYYFGE